MNNEIQLHHKLITLPAGKRTSDFVAERHDIVFLFDCAKSNPNGDPDTGNMPRIQPDSLKGLVTDVCQKRKLRNFFSLYNPDGTPRPDGATATGYDIFIREASVHETQLNTVHQILCRNVVVELLDELVEGGFLIKVSRQDIEDGLADTDFPKKPEECEDFVREKCKGKLDFTKLVKRVQGKLAGLEGFPAEVIGELEAFELPEDARNNAEKAQKAIEKKCKDAAPKGTKPAVMNALKDVFAEMSPNSVIAARFSKLNLEKANRDAICATYFDVRSFGAVVSTEGPLTGSFFGQIRGPLQFTFAESLDRVLPLDSTITRCSVANEELAKKKEREFGRKHGIDYGLYRCHIHFSPAFAAKTRFTYYDLDNFLFALVHMFDDDHAAGRHLRLVGLVDFQHQSALGNAPAHKLFELVNVRGKKAIRDGKEVFESSGSEFPRSGEAGQIIDYHGSAPGELDKYTLVSGYENKGIKARKIVWEIPQE